jgi:O-antigen ligase
MALIFAIVGVEQWITRDIFWNPKLLVGNSYAPFYRVNSLFWDPSIYGRFLVVAMLAALVAALWTRLLRIVLAAAGAIAVMAIGLLFSFSQSSFVALAVGVLVAAAFTWRRRALLLVGLAAAVFVIAAIASPNVLHHRGGLNRITSGRSKLVTNGIKLAVHHPVIGVGIGGFKHGYAKQQHLRSNEPKAAASHDTPITVAAETGIPGLALLAWLFVAGLLLAFRRVGPALAGRAALFFGLVLTVIGVHSLFYNAFFEDPMVWAALGLAALTGRQHKRSQPPELDRQVEPERQQEQRVDGHKAQRTGERDMERLPDHG